MTIKRGIFLKSTRKLCHNRSESAIILIDSQTKMVDIAFFKQLPMRWVRRAKSFAVIVIDFSYKLHFVWIQLKMCIHCYSVSLSFCLPFWFLKHMEFNIKEETIHIQLPWFRKSGEFYWTLWYTRCVHFFKSISNW